VRYDPSFYDGAAVHYRHGRPAYSPRLEALLAEELGLDGSGRLLDVGCGPGILTVRLAQLFAGAVGLDPDPAMIAEGRRAAQQRDIANITWIQACSVTASKNSPTRCGNCYGSVLPMAFSGTGPVIPK
jgi:trans-aconitate methyltransferase